MSTRAIIAAAAIFATLAPARAQPSTSFTLIIAMTTQPGAISRAIVTGYPSEADCRNASAAVLRQRVGNSLNIVMFCVPVGAVPQ